MCVLINMFGLISIKWCKLAGIDIPGIYHNLYLLSSLSILEVLFSYPFFFDLLSQALRGHRS